MRIIKNVVDRERNALVLFSIIEIIRKALGARVELMISLELSLIILLAVAFIAVVEQVIRDKNAQKTYKS